MLLIFFFPLVQKFVLFGKMVNTRNGGGSGDANQVNDTSTEGFDVLNPQIQQIIQAQVQAQVQNQLKLVL